MKIPVRERTGLNLDTTLLTGIFHTIVSVTENGGMPVVVIG